MKYKYSLSVDREEKVALQRQLRSCAKREVPNVKKVAVVQGDPVQQPSGTAPYFANCTEAREAGVTPIRRDENPDLYEANRHMDRDGDGDACE